MRDLEELFNQMMQAEEETQASGLDQKFLKLQQKEALQDSRLVIRIVARKFPQLAKNFNI